MRRQTEGKKTTQFNEFESKIGQRNIKKCTVEEGNRTYTIFYKLISVIAL